MSNELCTFDLGLGETIEILNLYSICLIFLFILLRFFF